MILLRPDLFAIIYFGLLCKFLLIKLNKNSVFKCFLTKITLKQPNAFNLKTGLTEG
jgi:hypothetical protein